MQAAKPSPIPYRGYVTIALILGLVTAIEFGIVYMPQLGSLLIPLLALLSIGKFALVALYFMHLKGDLKVFWLFFASGLFLATIVVVSLRLLLSAGHVNHMM